MTQVSVEQATKNLGKLVDAAMNGEDVVVIGGAERGAVRLVPVAQPKRRPQFGSAKGEIVMSDDFDAPLEDFREHMK